ncbi:uncharacterized protein J4E92_010217 [Alternaria infectoria]|uniref:uncharacterized protein n=1 Tax=Alternaria infectoria TaxID=45303 RepID=UPI00221F116D|nr:uncharacterized protein J4E92_010217 [Alternaria infectoria]KAI4911404.1 hypothetical protein J4E92_010217 [Alternaria infectoria]
MAYRYHAFINTQSNHGFDAISEKFAKCTRKNRSRWIEERILCRVAARIVDEVLFEELKRHWGDAGDDDGAFGGLMSSITASNIPDCSAYKMAKYARSNPTEESCLPYTKNPDARAEQKRKFQTGQVKIFGATVSPSSAIWELMKACIGKPKLVAATSTASQREVIQRILGLSNVDKFDMVLFYEASQATEAS